MPAPGPFQSVLAAFPNFRGGSRLVDGTDMKNLVERLFQSQNVGLTALAGGAVQGATKLYAAFNQVDVVATAGDSGQLPAAIAGALIFVFNNGANAMQVFGIASDQMVGQGNRTGAGVPGTTGISLPSGTGCIFVCYQTSTWKQHIF